MGAASFCNYLVGKDLDKTFMAVTREARYMDGHGGYTGTIAEKYDYINVGTMPPRLTVDRLVNLIWDYEQWLSQKEDYERGVGGVRKSGKNPVPNHLQAFVEKVAGPYGDKWGPAVVIELDGTQKSRVKERYGRKGTQDRVWVAIGMASS